MTGPGIPSSTGALPAEDWRDRAQADFRADSVRVAEELARLQNAEAALKTLASHALTRTVQEAAEDALAQLEDPISRLLSVVEAAEAGDMPSKDI